MEVFRLCLKQHMALDGKGSRLYGGRWNSSGYSVIYTSANLSLAVLEYLVHVELDNLPADLVWLKIRLPPSASIEKFAGTVTPSEAQARYIGDQWVENNEALVFIVPSVILPTEKNILINAQHSEMSRVKIIEQQPFVFDQRLFKR